MSAAGSATLGLVTSFAAWRRPGVTGCFASFELPSGGRLAQEFFDVLGKLLTLLGELESIGMDF